MVSGDVRMNANLLGDRGGGEALIARFAHEEIDAPTGGVAESVGDR